MNSKEKKIIIFDGVCNFCNWSVNFVIKRDKHKIFMFAPSQGIAGKNLLEKYQLENTCNESIILIFDDSFFVKSEAILEIFKYLGSGWVFMKYLKVFPRKLRDWGYSVFGKHRYSLFGKRDTCMIPSDDVKERFLN